MFFIVEMCQTLCFDLYVVVVAVVNDDVAVATVVMSVVFVKERCWRYEYLWLLLVL